MSFLDCFGEIVPLPTHILRSQFMPNAKDASTSAHSRTFVFEKNIMDLVLSKSLERFIKCFHIPRTTESTEVHRVGDFLTKKFQSISEIEQC